MTLQSQKVETAGIEPAKGFTRRQPVWRCEFCGRYYSERTAKDHAYCVQEYDRRCAEQAGVFDV